MRQTTLIPCFIALAFMSTGCAPSTVTGPKVSFASQELEARESVRSILFDQRTHFIGNKSFSTSPQDLKTMTNGVVESASYKYRIQPKPSKEKGVMVTAISKRPGLRSFTGVVFAMKDGKEKIMVSEICETMKASNQPPKAPAIPQQVRQPIQCPVGSQSSTTLLALQ
jgi:hypothetical protein